MNRTSNIHRRLRTLLHLLALCLIAVPAPSAFSAERPGDDRPRLIILTDISSLNAAEREPDDGQSLIRLILYSNDIEIEGLIASSNMGHGQVVRPELIRQVVEAYEKVHPSLVRHDPRYPEAKRLMDRIRAGQPIAGPKVEVTQSIGDNKDTPASDFIIQVVDRADDRPVHVAIWGGSADLAQALHKVRRTRDAQALKTFLSRLRIHAVNEQDSTGRWIRENFPELHYVWRRFAIRGMYRGGDQSLVNPRWVETHIRNGRGALGALYPNYSGGDIWGRQLGPVKGIKEGDTPSFLGLIRNGLNEPAYLNWGGWGGRVERVKDTNQFADANDSVPGSEKDLAPAMSSVHRWRSAYQADFAARLLWCVNDPQSANHAPRAILNNQPGLAPLQLKARPGESITLDASASTDPDNNAISHRWWIYREAGTCPHPPKLTGADTPRAVLRVPDEAKAGQTLHLILEVKDDGRPALTGYRRVVIAVQN